jgi:ATP-dependent helicase HepA
METIIVLKVGLGALVESGSAFKGIGKIVSIDSVNQLVTVGFFTSPLKPYDNQLDVHVSELKAKNKLHEQTAIYCRIGNNQDWMMGYYDGERPNDEHLVKFNASESTVLELKDLFVPNLASEQHYNPVDFLGAKATSAPFLYESRRDFYQSYIQQRAACASLSSISSSAVNLENHQLAVVMQVLNDKNQKYLLGDEVGLGKTIEAGFLINEHILEYKENSCVFVLVPEPLVEQWNQELKTKFHLAEVMDEYVEEGERKVFVGCYKDILKFNEKIPSMVVVDEAHQLGPMAWNKRLTKSYIYSQIAESCHKSISTLLLSGTPVSGNTHNFLAMLHCLHPEGHEISDAGVLDFENKVAQRDKYAGIYSALKPSTDNETLEVRIDDIEAMELNDPKLTTLLEELKEYVDYFSENVDPIRRSTAINELKNYFGDKYSLSKRFIRTRRDTKNSLVEGLFPGLGKYDYIDISNNSEILTLDELLEEYRILLSSLSQTENLQGLSDENFDVWLEALFTSPISLFNLANVVVNGQEIINVDEAEILKQIIENAPVEQKDKDMALLTSVENWVLENPQGKVVIFCGDINIADHVNEFLVKHINYSERHKHGVNPRFLFEDFIKVLICDQHGEDGLNLQGTKRLAIHYSLPKNTTRIEQRIGRLNRYSANNRNFKPVENRMFTYPHDGYCKSWSQLLSNNIKIFSHNRASIQLRLDSFFSTQHSNIIRHGYLHYKEMGKILSGETGLIAKELKQIENQEVWNNTRIDLVSLTAFSNKLKKSDEESESQFTKMSNWIKGGLLFDVKRDENKNFVYQYNINRTRLNIDDFLQHCLIGMDFESGFKSPATKAMNENRDICSETGSFPFRYGQPFVDTIYDFSNFSPIGLSNAIIRVLNTPFKKPMLMFNFRWLVELENTSDTRVEQRNNDLLSPPQVVSMWLNSEGEKEERIPLIDILNKPYQKSLALTGEMYQDFNVKNGFDQNIWEAVDSMLDEQSWSEIVKDVSNSAHKTLSTQLKNEGEIEQIFNHRLLSVQFVALTGN